MFNIYTRIIGLVAVLGVLGLAPAAGAANTTQGAPRFIENNGMPGWEEGGSFVPQSTLDAFRSASARQAAGRKYSAKLMSAPLSTADGYPNPGGTAVLAGSLKSKPFGAGALVDRVTMTGQPFGTNVFTFEGTEVAFFAQGTQRSTFAGTDEIREDGTHAIVVLGRVTGGTGRYRGARGEYRFEGTIPSGSTVLTGRSTGRVTF